MKELHTSRNIVLLAAVLTALFFVWVTWATCTFTTGSCFDSDPQMGSTEIKEVTFVIDGDSFTVEGGREVRLIGVDAPERGDPYYEEARQLLTSLIYKEKVLLEIDIDDRDKYKRDLRYVYVDDTFVNEKMLAEGFATQLTIPPNIKYVELLKNAQDKAREENIGVWKEIQ